MSGGEDLGEPPWPVLRDETIDVDGGPDAPAETADRPRRRDAGRPRPGDRARRVRPRVPAERRGLLENRPTIAWVQGTDLGVDAVRDNEQPARVGHRPVDGHADRGRHRRRPGGRRRRRPPAPTAWPTSALPSGQPDGLCAVTATRDGDVALLPAYRVADAVRDPGRCGTSSTTAAPTGPARPYRAKGWVRSLSADRQLQAWDGDAVDYVAYDGTASSSPVGAPRCDPTGSFDFEFAIPAGANTGAGWVQPRPSGAPTGEPAPAADRRVPASRLRGHDRPAGAGRTGAPTPITVTADGRLLRRRAARRRPRRRGRSRTSDGDLPPARLGPLRLRPRGRRGGSTSDVVRRRDRVRRRAVLRARPTPAKVETFTGRTDAAGTHALDLRVGDLDADLDGLPVTVRANAAVQDVDRQTIAAHDRPARPPRRPLRRPRAATGTFVRRGEPLGIDVIVTDIDGAAVAGRDVEVVAGRTERPVRRRRRGPRSVDTDDVHRDVRGRARAVHASRHRPAARTASRPPSPTTPAGRSRSELTRWVSGAEASRAAPSSSRSSTLVPDADEYAPGDTAAAARAGAVRHRRRARRHRPRPDHVDDDVRRRRRLGGRADRRSPTATSRTSTSTIEVVGSAPRRDADGTPVDGAPRPTGVRHRHHHAAGLDGQPHARRHRRRRRTTQLAPGAATTLDVDGRPTRRRAGRRRRARGRRRRRGRARAQRLRARRPVGDVLRPPADATWRRRTGATASCSSTRPSSSAARDAATTRRRPQRPRRRRRRRRRPPRSRRRRRRPDGSRTPSRRHGRPPRAGQASAARRSTCAATSTPSPLFAPAVTTDADGHATVDVPLPDNLTRYRVMVVAAAGADQFGTGEANITARLPLMVRPSRAAVPELRRPLRAAGRRPEPDRRADGRRRRRRDRPTSSADGPAGVRVTVPANDRVEVRFPVAAAEAGTRRFRVDRGQRRRGRRGDRSSCRCTRRRPPRRSPPTA